MFNCHLFLVLRYNLAGVWGGSLPRSYAVKRKPQHILYSISLLGHNGLNGIERDVAEILNCTRRADKLLGGSTPPQTSMLSEKKILSCVRQVMGRGEDWEFRKGRSSDKTTAKLILYHAIRDESEPVKHRIMGLDHSSLYYYKQKYEDVMRYPWYDDIRTLINKFDKIYDYMKVLDENDFWNCEHGIFAGNCRCKLMDGEECVLTKGAECCPNFKNLCNTTK